ncbi:MAG: hypothetical protein SGPRY_008674 [Prymnesium sp.]
MRSKPSVIDLPATELWLARCSNPSLDGCPCSRSGEGRMVLLVEVEPAAAFGVAVEREPARSAGVPLGVELGVGLGVLRGVAPREYDIRSCASLGVPGCEEPSAAAPASALAMRCAAADSLGEGPRESILWMGVRRCPPPGSAELRLAASFAS